MSAILLDTETTGLDQPRILEAAWLIFTSPGDLTPQQQFWQRYQPGKPKVATFGKAGLSHAPAGAAGAAEEVPPDARTGIGKTPCRKHQVSAHQCATN